MAAAAGRRLCSAHRINATGKLPAVEIERLRDSVGATQVGAGTRGKGKVGVKLRDSDWWCITIDHDHFSLEEDELYRHREKVRREIRALSPEGKKERHRTVSMAARAYSDSAFQQFKRRLLLQAKGAVQHG